MTTRYSRRALACALLAGTCLAAPALAQMPGSVPPPPVRQSIDENGVDVLRGTFNVSQTPLSIGPDAQNGFAYTFQSFNAGYRDAFQAFLSYSGSTYTVTLNGASETFTYNGSTFDSTEGSGATLAGPLGFLTYTARDGTVATFQLNTGGSPFYDAPQYRPLTVTRPNGLKIQYLYKNQSFCIDPQLNEFDVPYCPAGATRIAQRLQSVSNSNGYMLKFSYGANTIDPYGAGTDYGAWSALVSVKAINTGVEYCDGAADSCNLSQNWPQASFVRAGNQYTITDSAGRATRYTSDGANRVTAIKRPGASSDNVTVAYNASGQVASVAREGVTYTYSYSDAGSTRTTTVTDPLGNAKVYVGDTSTNLIASFRNELNQTTGYLHDDKGRITRITAPEGNYTHYTYDARGNVTETRNVAKPGSGLADIVTTAGFPASCANPKTCNKPEWTRDAAGNQTDYTYDGTHGGLLTVTLPAPSAGAVRPQTRYAYSGLQAYSRQSAAGAPAASGQTTYLPTATSACQTQASCAGTADEAKTTVSYGPQSAGTANNLLPVSISSGAGDGSLTATTAATYDSIGNTTYVDGPLAGSADTTRTIYDAARQVVGTIGPDPDGAGVLKNRAVRLTYNADGQVTKTETGTTIGQSDAAWAEFTRLMSAEAGYDGNGRKWFDSLTGTDGAIYSYVRRGYDQLGREICVAQRMNPAVWPETTQDPCQLAATGSYGADRIVRASYDAVSRLTGTTSGYGTAEAGSEGSLSFTANGRASTFTDGEGHVTTFEYDGFDRLVKTRFPNVSGTGSSTADYEQLSYDARSLVTSRRLRDGNIIGYSYDVLGRVILKDAPGIGYYDTDVTYTYDLLGRLKTATSNYGEALSYGYDALGRLTGETNNVFNGTRLLQYDPAGRLTRMTWQDGFYVTYGYDLAGALNEVREYGTSLLAVFAYDDLGRRTLITRGNGTTTGYSYNAAFRLSDLSQDLAGTAYDGVTSFAYNPAGQIVSRTSSNDAYAFTNHVNRDLAETSNGLNQLTQQGANTVGYDARANANYVAGTSYGYTSENRMNNAAGIPLAYDPAGRLFYVGTSPSGQYFDYTGSKITSEAQAGLLTRRYVWGPGADEPLVEYDVQAGTKRWLHADERGSIIAVSDSSGNITGINKYDDYGQPQGTLTGRFGYTGQAWLPEVGLAYYKVRMYHPGLGRFMQTDPAGYGQGQNLFGYVFGDPTNLTDPSGMGINIKVEDSQAVRPIEPGTGTLIAGHESVSSPVRKVGFGNPAGGNAGDKSGGGGGKVDPGTIVVMATLGTDPTGGNLGYAPGVQLASGSEGTIFVTGYEPIPRGSYRPLLPSDLGPNANVVSLYGEIGIQGRNLNIFIRYIEGNRGVLRVGVRNAVNTARSLGLTNVNITAYVANEQLGRVLVPQSSLFREYPGTEVIFSGPLTTFRIPVPK